MANKEFERFGKYLILDHLVDGGMAKICRARYLGEQSNKVVAIKMVQSQFSRDPSFVRMFQDELSVTFGLLHPNIAQTYDYGKVNDQLYTAMEYVDGANLKQFLDRLKEKNFVFPVEISIYIISQVCQGLHYAHTFTDKLSGKPLHIVHRDISPHNIMLTYDGAVKVIDFGIAKSNANSEATQAGTIKGKLSYLAPEYLDGMELDARYDEFAVGITLWEMLCSRKLFTAANDLAVLKQIQACKIPTPSSINPNVSKELDAIVMKALSKDRSQRFEDMDKFNRALVKFLYAHYPDFNPSDLSYFAKELFKDEIKRDREKFVEYGKIDVQPFIEEMQNNENGRANPSAPSLDHKKDEPQRQERIELDLELSTPAEPGSGPASPLELASSKVSSTRKVLRQVTARPAVKSNVNGVDSKTTTSTKLKENERAQGLGRTTNKIQQVSSLDPETKPNSLSLVIILVASLCSVVYWQEDFIEEMTGISLSQLFGDETDRGISSVEVVSSGDSAQNKLTHKKLESGSLVLSGVEFDMEVFVAGKRHTYINGATIAIPFNRPVEISVKKVGHKTFTQTVRVNRKNPTVLIKVPEPVRARMGVLSSSLNYGAGSVLVFEVDGQKFERSMPFKDLTIPSGNYEATVRNTELGTERKINFTIEENKVHLLE